MLYLTPGLLVVDDEALVRTCLSDMLTRSGYTVRDASDGFSALAAIREEIPDLILSDLNMPGMSGFEFLSVVRRRFPSIRVIAMSSAYAGVDLPPGVAADVFYQKGSHPDFPASHRRRHDPLRPIAGHPPPPYFGAHLGSNQRAQCLRRDVRHDFLS